MKDFRSIYKQLARSKSLSSRNVVEYAILRSMDTVENPTDENLINQAAYHLNRAFTPITHKVKLDNGREPRDTLAHILFQMHIFRRLPVPNDETIFETVEGVETYERILSALYERCKKPYDYCDRYYMYVFVRQDISPEYQAVQAAHAAAKMGSRYQEYSTSEWPAKRFDELYMTLIGVPDLAAMAVAMKDCNAVGATVYPFLEPDIGNVLTAFATSPIRMQDRKRLLSYKKLRFRKG